ncbi:hypothetical protein [Duganella fentianensis]|uniref:hypothetical protein n=1 Tax=Duganella fentianensis TaxID=2692177 RepID=UPI00192561D2
MRTTLMQQNSVTLAQLEYACNSLNTLYQACQWRKTDRYLIPALRAATERADQLLDELNRLNQSALAAVRALQEQAEVLADAGEGQVQRISDNIEAFCTAMLQKLEKEEHELFALARNSIAGDAWFSIANQLMLHDKRVEELKRSAPPAVLPDAAAINMPRLQVLPMIDMNLVQDDTISSVPHLRARAEREVPAPK